MDVYLQETSKLELKAFRKHENGNKRENLTLASFLGHFRAISGELRASGFKIATQNRIVAIQTLCLLPCVCMHEVVISFVSPSVYRVKNHLGLLLLGELLYTAIT